MSIGDNLYTTENPQGCAMTNRRGHFSYRLKLLVKVTRIVTRQGDMDQFKPVSGFSQVRICRQPHPLPRFDPVFNDDADAQ